MQEFVYPRGGFRRAAQYLTYRLRRLPDEPHRIARGVFAGVFVSFTPLFGFHFLSAAGLAWLMRGNILAALLATFIGNPLTTPFIALSSVELGHWMTGIDAPLDFVSIVAAFSDAGVEIWQNIRAIFTADPTDWSRLGTFFHYIYWPYLVGGILPGLVVSTLFYWAAIPLVRTYQKIRATTLRDRVEKRRVLKTAVLAADKRARVSRLIGDDGGPRAP